MNIFPSGAVYHACTSTLHAKFEMSSFTHSKHMVGVKNLKNGSRDTALAR